ncbi:Nup192p [Sugiyamaella lignohabitans]|uniref:Nup192p n=1 Tax=Sugiyamaella lignohabitans TaxID=796027 RepID=A0A167C0E3_9ASCO|nr:Nup192p [Sugiyamaella lignohabitans]ANB11060.1 Nup192p [Sugiyamaella lignohabitans]
MLSEELNIDEVVAAEMVYNSSDDLNRLDMSPLQAGVALFHVRRQYILDLIRYFLVESGSDDRISDEFRKIVKSWSANGNDAALDSILEALKSVEEAYAELNEKEKRGQFLGQMNNAEFVQLLKLRRDFLLREHDYLGQILCGLVQNRMVDAKGFAKLISKVQTLSEYDTMFVHYIPSLLLYMSTFDPALTGTGYSVDFEEAYNGYKELSGDAQGWKLDYWKGALSLAMLSGFSGCCRADTGDENGSGTGSNLIKYNISYELSILDPTKQAIDIGGIEFLMILAANTSQTLSKKPHFYDYRPSVQNKVPSLKRLGDFSDEFLALLLQELERLVESVVTNLADILKEMRLNEEDAFLSLTSVNNEFDHEEVDMPGADLERFFIFVSYLYSDRPDASINFWLDPESSLYGFTTWARQSHISFMAATLCDMLASLASGKECANAVYQLLKDDSDSEENGEMGTKINAAAKGFSMGLAKLDNGNNNMLKRMNNTSSSYRLTWDVIFDALDYYAKQLQPHSAAPSSSLSMGGLGAANGRQNALVLVTDMPELDDDIVLLLSAYFRLITVTISNDPEARLEFTTAVGGKYISTLFELLHSQTSLYGSILMTLAGFAKTDNEQIRYALWTAVDNWLFNSTVYSPDGTVIAPSLPPRERLAQLFRSSSDIVGLITLLEALMSPLPQSARQGFPFPQDLGSKYRYPGIWPYVDFIINEVFLSSASPTFTQDERLFIQLPCLLFIQYSLELLDPDVTRLSSTLGINPDIVVRSPSFLSYLYNHPSAPTMSHLFSSKIYSILISIASAGIDEIGELGPDEPLVQAVVHSIRIMNDILDLQQIFLDVIVKEFKHGSSANGPAVDGVPTVPPLQIVTHGLKAFEDVLLFNLPTVIHLALYIGSSNIELASRSLQLLQRLSLSSQFVSTVSTDARVKKNRLLSTLETADESNRIKEGFLEQLERPVDSYVEFNNSGSLPAIEIKLALLDFIICNLKTKSREPTTAHFLLGFKTTGDGKLDLDDGRCGIATGVSSFNSILSLLQYGIENISGTDVEYGASKLSNACMEIILLLVQDPLSSQPILQLLRDTDFALSSLMAEPVVGQDSLWNGQPYESTAAFSTIVSFFNHRSSLLEYVSLEIHESAELGSLSLVLRYVDSLVNLDVTKKLSVNHQDSEHSAAMLSLLDVLEMPSRDQEPLQESSLEFFGSSVLNQIFSILGNSIDPYANDLDTDNESAMSELNHLLKLKGLEFVANGKIQSLEDGVFKAAVEDIVSFMYNSRTGGLIRDTQLKCLRSWSKLALVLVNDANVPSTKLITFILEIFQTLIPKLVDYSSSDIAFAEVLASLLVSLQHIYQNEAKVGHGNSELNTAGYDRSHSLFRASLESIQTPLATPELRADLYIICYQYLKSTLDSPQAQQVIQVVRAAGDRLLETICGDALSGEGVTRLVALIFLEVLFSLSSKTRSTFVQDGLVRYNLLLLLVKSIQRTDHEISNRDSLSPSELFFELKVFNATLCFLLQVARTRSGASQLIQSGLFDILDGCQFLNIDLDVGIEISSPIDHRAGAVSDLKISFYEILVPVFQILCAVLLSMGAENEPVITRVRRFLEGHQQLVVAIMKKDMLQSSRPPSGDESSEVGLDDLVKLTVLLVSLTEFVPNL